MRSTVFPKVSVAIITYNQEEFVRETLDSVLEQNYPNLEIVVSDDGSTDSTPHILMDYQERHPNTLKVLAFQPNVGITKNCNRAFFACTGKYIAWLGGDDLFYPGKLQKQVEAMEANLDCPLSYHSVEAFDSDTGKVIAITNLGNKPKRSLQQILHDGVGLASSSVMVRRECCPAYGFDESISVASDWLFYLETLYHGSALRIEGIFGGYRRHAANATNKSVIHDMEASYKKVREAHPELSPQLDRALAISYYEEGHKFLGPLKQLDTARQYFRKAIHLSPSYKPAWKWLLRSYLSEKLIDKLRQLKQAIIPPQEELGSYRLAAKDEKPIGSKP